MIPTRLELRNFLAYRAPEPIDFEGIELACLTGHNGVGKSSILDAITWALWGRARAKRDEELIHLGQNDMSVQIDFEQEGLRYRVLRRRSRSGRGSRGALDLMVWGAGEFPRIINEEGTRRTQEKINEILRLDYETFVHSAFLQQGRADAFTLKTAAERKRILADILGLDQWTGYEDAAKERLNALASQIDIIQHDISRIDEEIAREPELTNELEAVMTSLAAAQERLNQAEEAYSRVANAADALRRERENLNEQERLIAGRHDDTAAAEAEIKRQAEKIANYQETIAQTEIIESGYSQLLAARDDQTAIAEQLTRKQELDQQFHQLQRSLAEKRAALSSEADVLRERIRGLENQLAAAVDSDIEALRTELNTLQTLESQRDKTAKSIQKIKERRSGLLERQASLSSEGVALNERLERLQVADGATCPLCGQALTTGHRDEIMAQIETDRNLMRDDYRNCTAEISEIDEGRKSTERDLEVWASQLKELPALQQRLGALTANARKAEEAEASLQIERSQLDQLEKRLANEDFAEELRRQLAQLEGQRDGIGYDPDSHADIKTQLQTLAAYDRQHTQLEFANINLPEAQKIRDDTAARLTNLRETLAQDEIKLERIKREIAAQEENVEREREKREEVEQIRSEVAGLTERKTILAQELNAISAGRESKRRLSDRLESAQHKRGLYTELRVAFGKSGVPALIIEEAVPELEAEANDLLSRMTDGRMSLSVSTQREKITGGIAETLDIEIGDELGSRSYELFSGGEAFRINFAIRIALSKLLARRAGAQLRTLFIDEGFGSQDEDGRDKLIDAINKIQTDFDLILVITHIDELRDSFPVHLLVEKTPDGSIVTVQ